MQHSIDRVEVSPRTGFDYIRARTFAGNEPAAPEVAFEIYFAQSVFATRDRADVIFHQMSTLVEDPVDGFHRGIDRSVSGR